MARGFHDYLDPAPFVAWVKEQVEDCGGNLNVCGARLGTAPSTVKAWSEGTTRTGEPLEGIRALVADRALTHAGWTLAMIYPNDTGEAFEGWCGKCQEPTITGPDHICLWCGSKVGKRRGGRRRITDDQIRAAHRLYQRPMTFPQLGELLWEKFGYASAKSCEIALQKAFHDLGLLVRSQGWHNVKHGLARRDGDLSAYQKLRRRRQGKARPCRGVRTQYPRKGQRCSLYAMHGSDYCVHHDPNRAEERREHLHEIRGRRKV